MPEVAIVAFERAHNLRVTVHDLHGSLWPFLAPHRFQHEQPICQAIKHLGRQNLCVRWEITGLRREAATIPEGRVQVCHAGLVEWAVPVFNDNQLDWVLFAGVRSVAPGLVAAYDEHRPLPDHFWQDKAGFNHPAPVDNEEATWLLEHLRQLAARLRLWRLDNEAAGQNLVAGTRFPIPSDNIAARRTLILRFIAARHTEAVRLADLARQLGLSEGRASHAIGESCGATFQELVIQARLRTAMGLLRHSGLSVQEIALRSGFNSSRQLHRLFQRETGTSPLQYRKIARA